MLTGQSVRLYFQWRILNRLRVIDMKKQTYLFSDPQVQTNSGSTVPFSSVFAPMAYIGEAITEALFSAVRLGSKFMSAWRRERAINESITVLSKLSDHTLKDIGIERSQIATAARELANRSNRYLD